MTPIDLQQGDLRLSVLPELGAAAAGLWLRVDGRWLPLWREAPQATRFQDTASYIMVPWTNRVAGAAFRFAGREHALRSDWPDGTAIHGDVKHRRFDILDRSPTSVRMSVRPREQGCSPWPWDYRCEVRYEVDGAGVLASVVVVNESGEEMPAGAGFHPFWSRSLVAGEDVRVRVSTAGRYPSRGQIPTGPAAADDASRRLAEGGSIGEHEYDDVFAGFDGRAELVWPRAGVRCRYECSAEVGHVVVFAPRGGSFVCVEPVTMANDGFNLMARGEAGTGVRVLGPGERLTVRWRAAVGRLER